MYSAAHRTLDRGEYKDAERRFATIVEIEPIFARAWAGRGAALMMQGELEDAMVDFDRAISLRPNIGSLYGQRALVRVSMSDFEGAKRDALRALELDDELVGTGYRITPVVGFVAAPPAFEADTQEVAEVFKVPLSFVLEPANYRRDKMTIGGVERRFYVLPYEAYHIWGATAAILVNFRDVVRATC